MKLDLSKIEYSQNDLRLGIKIPRFLNEQLAYFIGFHAGDGYMNIQKRKHATDYRLEYTGHLINEEKWYFDFITPLIKKLFNKQVLPKRNRGTIQIIFCSKAILSFLHNSCELVLSKKTHLKIPYIILNSKLNIKAAFLRGLADTDFSLLFKKNGKYLVISHATNSYSLHTDILDILCSFGFSFFSSSFQRERNSTKLITHRIEINGRKNLDLWIDKISYSSYNSITRYLVWKHTGKLPPNTDINERTRVLKSEGIDFPQKSAPGRI